MNRETKTENLTDSNVSKLQVANKMLKPLHKWLSEVGHYTIHRNYKGPVTAQFGITYACNMNCMHCYSKLRRSSRPIPYQRMLELLDEIVELGCFRLFFSHGESLLHPKCLDFIRYSRDLDLHTTLISNGLLIDSIMAAKISFSGVNRVLISIDSADPKIHDNFRQYSGAWQSAVNAIRQLLALNVVQVGIAASLSQMNLKNVQEIIDMGFELGIRYFSFMTVRPTSGSNIYFSAMRHEYLDALLQLWLIRRRLAGIAEVVFHDPLVFLSLWDTILTYDEAEWLIGQNTCFAGRSILSVSPEGNVYPCNFIKESIGNINQVDLSKLWHSDLLRKIRERKISNLCHKCSASLVCNGGCYAFWQKEKQIDSRCQH